MSEKEFFEYRLEENYKYALDQFWRAVVLIIIGIIPFFIIALPVSLIGLVYYGWGIKKIYNSLEAFKDVKFFKNRLASLNPKETKGEKQE